MIPPTLLGLARDLERQYARDLERQYARDLERRYARDPEAVFAKAAQRGSIKPGHKYHRRWQLPSGEWRYEYYDAKHDRDHRDAAATIFPWRDGKVMVAMDYDVKLKDKVKALPGAKFDGPSKSWLVPTAHYGDLERTLGSVVLTDAAHKQLEAAGFPLGDGPSTPPAPSTPPTEPTALDRKPHGVTHAGLSGDEINERHTPTPGSPTPELDADGYPHATYALDPATSEKLLPEQRVDVQRVLARWRDGKRGIMLANGTGTGKTYVYAAAIKEMHARGQKVILFVPAQDTKAQVLGVLMEMGVPATACQIETYSALSLGKLNPQSGVVVIFDEAHKIKHLRGSKRAQAGLAFARAAKFAIFATATPFESPTELAYLASSGLIPNQSEGYRNFVGRYGVKYVAGFHGGDVAEFHGGPGELKRLHTDLKASGFLTKRVYEPPAGLVSGDTPPLELTPAWLKAMDTVAERLERAANANRHVKGLVMAQRTGILRQMLERAKVAEITPVIAKELAEGRSVAVFTQYRSDKAVSDAAWEDGDEDGAGNPEVRNIVQRALSGLDIPLESPTNAILRQFPHAELYTGEQTAAQLKKAKTRFQDGSAKLLVLTGAKGGTGLSFHDTVGNRPTTQIVVTLPWSATELDQMLGRAIRQGLKSDVRVLMPVSSAGFEKKLAAVIRGKLATMGYAVRGGSVGVGQELADAFEYGLAKADKHGFERMLNKTAAPDVVATPPPAAPDAPPPAAPVAPSPGPSPAPEHPGLEAVLPLNLNLFGERQPEPAPRRGGRRAAPRPDPAPPAKPRKERPKPAPVERKAPSPMSSSARRFASQLVQQRTLFDADVPLVDFAKAVTTFGPHAVRFVLYIGAR